MTRRGDRSNASSSEPYSPQRRTALLLVGTGTAGAYHAGVIGALHEAGVKVDVVSGRGVGVASALFAAIDSGPRLWDEQGFWRSPAVSGFYPWHPTLRLLAWAVAVAAAVVAVPLVAMAAALVVFPIDFVVRLLGWSGGGLTAAYSRAAEAALAPTALPTWLPRIALLVLTAAAVVAVWSAAMRGDRRRLRGPLWWRLVPAPLSAEPAIAHCWKVLWDRVRGAAHVKQPSPRELAHHYTDLLTENLGQPGFRELVVAAHDLDASRDVIFALVSEDRRRDMVLRPTAAETDARRAEVFDLAGVGRDYLADAVAAALTVPVVTDAHPIQYAVESYWRGETHRVCDRPGCLTRLVEELLLLEVEQIVLVSATPENAGPHTLARPRLDGRGRVGEYVQASEAATIRDVLQMTRAPGVQLFTIRPAHNPVGPFDFAGGFDDRSDRRLPLAELMARGYEDGYRQFVEPVVGPSGDRVGLRR